MFNAPFLEGKNCKTTGLYLVSWHPITLVGNAVPASEAGQGGLIASAWSIYRTPVVHETRLEDQLFLNC